MSFEPKTLATYPQVWFTYGPNTQGDRTVHELIEAGVVSLAFFTFSYGNIELQRARAQQVRRIGQELGQFVPGCRHSG